jgi:anthranilate synthase component 1
MSLLPDQDEFSRLASQYDVVPVYRRLLSDSYTPVSAFAALDDGHSPSCLFESVIGGEKVGRYSMVAVNPRGRLAAWGDRVEQTRDGHREQIRCADPLELIPARLGLPKVAPIPDLPPFIGGAVGYAGYDVVRYVENLPDPPQDDRRLPDLDFSFYDDLLVFDNVTKTMLVLALARPAEFSTPTAAYHQAVGRIENLIQRLSRPRPSPSPAPIALGGVPTLQARSNFTQDQFEEAVRQCCEYIRAGDIFQVVISQRWELPNRVDPLELYRSLRVINPSPFMFLLRTPDTTLVGASPEIMCRVSDRQVTVRPLAGTRPRGRTEQEDQQLAEELLADPKERAEHVMLVDLGRNDVGRVAKLGSVRLGEVMVVERYSHVMHISSNVEGELRPECTAIDALKACLPAGTVSGAPKVRAMEIIDRIEPSRRGPYAGAVGYFDYRGNMDTCIALRTMVLSGGKIYIQAGAGLVADSDPATEYQETINKSRAMLRAIEITEQRLGCVPET